MNWGMLVQASQYDIVGESIDFQDKGIAIVSQEASKDGQLIGQKLVSPNLLLLQFKCNQIGLIHLSEFSIGALENLDQIAKRGRLLSLDEIEAIIYRMKMILNLDEPQMLQLVKDNYIIHCHKQFVLYEFTIWEEYLNQFIRDSKWYTTMAISLQIQRGQLCQLPNLPTSNEQRNLLMNSFFQKLSFTYCLFLIKIPTDEVFEEQLGKIMDFLTITDNTVWIFTSIMELLDECGKLDIFYEVVEPRVLAGKIKYIPDKPLQKLCQKYQNKQFIYSLDLQQNEVSILIRACDDLESLTFLCNQINDFMTPLLKMLYQKSPLASNYIKVLLSGRKISGGFIGESYQEVIRNVINCIFTDENLEDLITADPLQACLTLSMFFYGKSQDTLSQLANQIKIKSDIHHQLFDDQMFNEEPDQTQTLNMKMFSMIHSKLGDDSYPFVILTTKLILLKAFIFNKAFIKVVFTKLITDIHIIVDNPQIFFPFNPDQEIIKKSLNKTLIQIIRDYIELKDFENFEVNDWLSENTLIKCYLNQLRPVKCFRYFAAHQYSHKIFDWLNIYLAEHQAKFYEQDQNFLDESILKLLKISDLKTFQLIENHLADYHQKIIQLLEKQPDDTIFIRYMNYLFKESSKKFMLNDSVKTLYIRHLCRTNRKQVIIELRTNQYPIDETLKVCEEFKIQKATAHLYYISGAIEKSLGIYTDIFLMKLKKIIVKLIKNPEHSPDKIHKSLQDVLGLLKQDDENLWFNFLDQFLKTNQARTYTDQKIPIQVRELLCKLLSLILIEIIDNVQVETFVQKLQAKYGNIPMQVFGVTIDAVRSKVFHNIKMYHQAQGVFNTTQHSVYDKLNSYQKGSWLNLDYCRRCKDPLNEQQRAYVFSCKHAFHEFCIERGYAQIPYCDICYDWTTYKILVEKFYKQIQKDNGLSDSQLEEKLVMEQKIDERRVAQDFSKDESMGTFNKKKQLKKFDELRENKTYI